MNTKQILRKLLEETDNYENESSDDEAKYKAVLFATNGDWVTDFPSSTIDGVKQKLANRGSRWFFYPFEGIMRYTGSHTTPSEVVIEMGSPLEFLSGKTIEVISKFIKRNYDALSSIF